MNGVVEFWKSGAALRLGQAIILSISQRIEVPRATTCSSIKRGRDMFIDELSWKLAYRWMKRKEGSCQKEKRGQEKEKDTPITPGRTGAEMGGKQHAKKDEKNKGHELRQRYEKYEAQRVRKSQQ